MSESRASVIKRIPFECGLLGDLTGPQLKEVAADFVVNGGIAFKRAALFSAIAERAGTGVVKDSVTDEQVEEISKALELAQPIKGC